MDEAAHASFQRCPADILGTGDIHGVIILHCAPRADHCGEVEHALHSSYRCYERIWVENVSAKERHIMLFEPGGILRGKGKHAHLVAALLQFQDEVTAQKAIP